MILDPITGAAVLIVNSKRHGIFRILIDPEDWESVSKRGWNASSRKKGHKFYFKSHVRLGVGIYRQIYLHRFIMNAPEGVDVDHKNTLDYLDNRRFNLRFSNDYQNMRNMRKTTRPTSSRFKGVSAYRKLGKWRAYIYVDARFKSLGLYNTEEEAARVYDAATLKHYGEFAHLNFPVVCLAA